MIKRRFQCDFGLYMTIITASCLNSFLGPLQVLMHEPHPNKKQQTNTKQKKQKKKQTKTTTIKQQQKPATNMIPIIWVSSRENLSSGSDQAIRKPAS